MSFLISDRVKETSTTTGTGTITLAGAVSGFDSFGAGIGDGNSTYYCISHKTLAEWEVGIGTYTASGTTLSRTAVLSSSNADAAVNFSAGDKDVFCTAPAGKLFTEGTVHAAASKTTPVDADELSILDSAASYVIKRLTWANLKATLKSYFDTLYASLAGATFTGPINEARGTVTMHATTMDLWAQPNIIDGTGSAVIITDIVDAPQAGASRTVYVPAGTIITDGATFAVDGNSSYTAKAGDGFVFEAVTTSTYKVHIITADGTAVAGSAASISAAIQAIYPIGSLYISTLEDNPNTILGFGTWSIHGAGRVMVCKDAAQTEFDTIGKTGGEKTHTLTIEEMPSHNHPPLSGNGFRGAAAGSSASGSGVSTSYPIHATTGNAGGGGAHNNLQPYIVINAWLRTA